MTLTQCNNPTCLIDKCLRHNFLVFFFLTKWIVKSILSSSVTILNYSHGKEFKILLDCIPLSYYLWSSRLMMSTLKIVFLFIKISLIKTPVTGQTKHIKSLMKTFWPSAFTEFFILWICYWDSYDFKTWFYWLALHNFWELLILVIVNLVSFVGTYVCDKILYTKSYLGWTLLYLR